VLKELQVIQELKVLMVPLVRLDHKVLLVLPEVLEVKV
jgi:hypothetical protein